MNSPEKLSFPLEAQHVSRRQILKAMGLLPVASALGADANPEYYEIHNIEPHVDIEKREIKQPVDLVASGTWGMEGATVRDGALVLAPLDRHIVNKRAGRRDPMVRSPLVRKSPMRQVQQFRCGSTPAIHPCVSMISAFCRAQKSSVGLTPKHLR
jgi:hypothetical protein